MSAEGGVLGEVEVTCGGLRGGALVAQIRHPSLDLGPDERWAGCSNG